MNPFAFRNYRFPKWIELRLSTIQQRREVIFIELDGIRSFVWIMIHKMSKLISLIWLIISQFSCFSRISDSTTESLNKLHHQTTTYLLFIQEAHRCRSCINTQICANAVSISTKHGQIWMNWIKLIQLQCFCSIWNYRNSNGVLSSNGKPTSKHLSCYGYSRLQFSILFSSSSSLSHFIFSGSLCLLLMCHTIVPL